MSPIATIIWFVGIAFWIKFLLDIRKRPDLKKSWFLPFLIIGFVCALLGIGIGLLVLCGVYWYKAGRISPSDGAENSTPFN